MQAGRFSFLDVADVEPLTIVDVGAAALDVEDGASYRILAERTGSHIIGFEPDPKACSALNAAGQTRHSYFPFAIGAGGPATLYETAFPLSSSLYKPNTKLVNRFTNLGKLLEVVHTHKVETHRLDDVVGADEIDFLKLDVQGAELDVLRGAERLVPATLVIQTEVEFLPIYENQPLFADVDRHLRARGFQLHRFGDLKRPLYTPIADSTQALSDFSQLMWSDAVYVPDVCTLKRFSRERLLKLVALLHDLYGSLDLCAHILMEMRQRGMAVPFDEYVKRSFGAGAK
jgi:FkbM family methyltransferase